MPFYTPSKHQNTIGLLMFSDGIKRQHWEEMYYDFMTIFKNTDQRLC